MLRQAHKADEEVGLITDAAAGEAVAELVFPEDKVLSDLIDEYFVKFLEMQKKKGELDGIDYFADPNKDGHSAIGRIMETAVATGSAQFSEKGVFEVLGDAQKRLQTQFEQAVQQAKAVEMKFIKAAQTKYPHLHLRKNSLELIANSFFPPRIAFDYAIKTLEANKHAFHEKVKNHLHVKENVKHLLKRYTDRIEGYGGKFDTGFTFWKGRQAANRKANYELAKKLDDAIEKGDVSIAKTFSEASIAKLRGGGTVRSDDLNEAIEVARTFSF